MSLSLQLLDPFQRHGPSRIEAVINEHGTIAGGVSLAAYSPSGAWLATLGTGPAPRLTIWDASVVGQPVPSVQLAPITGLTPSSRPVSLFFGAGRVCLAFSCGRYLLYALPSGTVATDASLLCESASALLIYADFSILVWSNGTVSKVVNTLEEACGSDESRLTALETTGSANVVHTTLIYNADETLTCAVHSALQCILAVGTPKGCVIVIDYSGAVCTQVLALGSTSAVASVAISRDSRWIAAASRDRSVRVLERCSPDAPRFRMHDAVNRYSWGHVGFGGVGVDTSVVYASVAETGRHLVYVWDLVGAASGGQTGTLPIARILDGGRDELRSLMWDPLKPEMLSVGVSGSMYIWAPAYPVSWGALVPGVEEIDENVVYEEREDDFDLVDDNAPDAGLSLTDTELAIDAFSTTGEPLLGNSQFVADQRLFVQSDTS